MDPNGNQFSINVSFNDNVVRGSGPPLPRSFKPLDHGKWAYRPFPDLLTAHRGLYSPFHEKRRYGVPLSLSTDHSRDLILDPFSLASIEGNSRAPVLAMIRRNQTRILFFLFTSTAPQQSIPWGKYNYVDDRLSFIPVFSNTGMKSPGRDFSTDRCFYARIIIPVCWAYQVEFIVRIKIRGYIDDA